MSRRAKGFTLIELLVVIAVIAVLAGIIYPIYMRAREKTRQATCLSNLKQLGLAVLMYAQDWDGRMPATRVDEGGAGNPFGNWAGASECFGKCDPTRGQLYPYVKNSSIYLCPGSEGLAPERIYPSALPYPISYSMNNLLSYRNLDNQRTSAARIGLLIHEDLSTLDDGDFNWEGFAGNETPDHSGHNQPGKMHNEGTNIMFCDMHAKWQRYEVVMQELMNDEWNPDKP